MTDVNGNEIGLTYPKRARGLVKSGRAEYAISDGNNDNDKIKIRLITQSNIIPTVHNDITEDKIMSKVINFNAREFKFDDTCNDNVGTRMFVTDCTGRSAEIYEIGDWGWAWTQICCEKTLEKNTDYLFRFSMTGGINDTCDATSQFVIVPIENEEMTLDDWENRYAYNLAQSQYKPAMSKRWGNGMLRIYEIPFNTGGCEKFRFVFIAMHAVAGIYPANELADYAELPDYSYGDWYNERFGGRNNFTGDFSNNIRDFVNRTVTNAMNGAIPSANYCTSSDGDGMNIERKNVNMTGEDFSGILRDMGDGCNLEISNCNISDVEEHLDCGCSSDGSNFEINNTTIGGRTFCCLLSKIGDGCNVDLSNTNISSVGYNFAESGCSSDGCYIQMRSATMYSSAFLALTAKLGDGCVVDLSNTFIKEDNTDIDVGCSSDGCVINLSNAKIPNSAYRKLKEKLGDGCTINESNTEIYFGQPTQVKVKISENEVLRKVANLMAVSGPSSAEYVQQKLGIDHAQAKDALTELCDRGLIKYLSGADEYLATISPEDMANCTFQE